MENREAVITGATSELEDALIAQARQEGRKEAEKAQGSGARLKSEAAMKAKDTLCQPFTDNLVKQIAGVCFLCGKEDPDVFNGQISYHSSCMVCPQCGSDFIIWQYNKRPYFFRCQKCLHGWEK